MLLRLKDALLITLATVGTLMLWFACWPTDISLTEWMVIGSAPALAVFLLMSDLVQAIRRERK